MVEKWKQDASLDPVVRSEGGKTLAGSRRKDVTFLHEEPHTGVLGVLPASTQRQRHSRKI
jgi:hypothetical protein